MTIVWSENAQNDIKDYIKNSRMLTDGKIENYISSLIDFANDLQYSPEMGRFLFNHDNFEIRQLIYSMHRIFYAIYNDNIYILNVYHTSRNINNIIEYLKTINLDFGNP